jgi:hypothetical protein
MEWQGKIQEQERNHMPTFTICWRIVTEGTISVDGKPDLEAAKRHVEALTARHLSNNGDTQHEEVEAPDGWEDKRA